MPRVRSPIKGDLYRGSLLNFWCVRPVKNRLSFKDIRVKLEGPSKNAYSDNLLGFDVSVFPPQDVKESKEGLNLILRETKRAME